MTTATNLVESSLSEKIRVCTSILRDLSKCVGPDCPRADAKWTEAWKALEAFDRGDIDPADAYHGDRCPFDSVLHGFNPGPGDSASWRVYHAVHACQFVLGLSERL